VMIVNGRKKRIVDVDKMFCSNCHKKITTDDKKIISIRYDAQGGIYIGDIRYMYSPDFCSKECAYKWFSDAYDVANENCENCNYTYWDNTDKLLCKDPRCPHVKCAEEGRIRNEISDRVIKRDGGFILHVIKTCKKHYFG
jgi:hypothetical protein